MRSFVLRESVAESLTIPPDGWRTHFGLSAVGLTNLRPENVDIFREPIHCFS